MRNLLSDKIYRVYFFFSRKIPLAYGGAATQARNQGGDLPPLKFSKYCIAVLHL